MVEIRKMITTRETIFSELGLAAPRPVVRAVGMAAIVNPSPDAPLMICVCCLKQERWSASA